MAQPLGFVTDQPLDNGIISAQWMTYEELQARNHQMRSPLVLAVIEDYLAEKIYPLELVQRQG